MAEVRAAKDGVKRRKVMNSEVFETHPEVTFQPYAAVNAAARRAQAATEAPARLADDEGNLQLDEQDVAPARAFEVFMGKVYKPRTEFEASGAADKPDGPKTGKKTLESPLARFTRLSVEIKELEADLTLLADGAAERKQRALVDAAQSAEVDDVLEGLATLQLNLASMEQNARFQPFLFQGAHGPTPGGADAALALQKDLTARFFQQIDALKRAQQGRTASDGKPPIVYEIFSNGELNAVDRDAKTRVAALEARLALLEKTLGTLHTRHAGVDGVGAALAGIDDGSADNVTSAVDRLEKRVNLLNEKNLDAIKTRTSALMHEFQLLNKLRESSSSVQEALAAQADREKLQQVYDKLTSLDDVAAAVPALVDRLVSLKAVHDDTLQMNGRVQTLERAHESLADLLESDAAMLANMEASLAKNVEIFQSNIQRLDERVEKLLHAGPSSTQR